MYVENSVSFEVCLCGGIGGRVRAKEVFSAFDVIVGLGSLVDGN